MPRTYLTLLFLMTAPSVSFAAPAVLFHVPDGATATVDGADIVLDDERAAVSEAEKAVIDFREEKEDLKARRRDARRSRRHETKQMRQAKHDLRKAERKDDLALAAAAKANLRVDADEYADADDHVEWHNAQIDTTKAKLRQARAERSLAKAELELEQAELLERRDAGIAPLLPTSVFEGQAKRIETRATMREADVTIEDAESSDAHFDYFASVR
ncbi:MAG: hypothetical protein EP330_14910 [Deltaproteobacteria bacterium]|nr:MAG: hypothetical protein EP330_14910 [Deltaproteobacteria bacterium]